MSKVGSIFKNSRGEEYEVVGEQKLRRVPTGKSYKRLIARFVKTGYIVSADESAMNRGTLKDRLSPSIHGVGIVGCTDGTESQKAKNIWKGILERCYNPSNPNYISYGGKGITISERWRRLDYFIEDIPKIEGYDEYLFESGMFELDKDKKQVGVPYHEKVYSLETCCFLNPQENSEYRDYSHRKKIFTAISPNGEKYTSAGVREFAKEHGLNHSAIFHCFSGYAKSHRGWKFYE